MIHIKTDNNTYVQRSSLESALSTSDITNKTIIVSGAESISGNTTIPSHVTLIIANQHSYITIPNDTVLTINGKFICQDSKAFDILPATSGTSGSVVFGLNSITKVLPEWFGAIGDGITDDSLAMQRAFNAFSAVEINKFYAIGTELRVTLNNSRIYGTGIKSGFKALTTISTNAEKYISGMGNGLLIADGLYDEDLQEFVNSYITLENLTVDCTDCTTASVDGILVFRWSEVTIKDCNIIKPIGNGIHCYDYCKRVSIVHNRIYGRGYTSPSSTNGLDGILVHSYCTDVVIDSNLVVETNIVGIEIEGRIGGDDSNIRKCSNIVISNNIINNDIRNNQGILANWSTDLSIIGNTIRRADGVHLLGCKNVTVTGNVFKDTWNMVIVAPENFTNDTYSSDIIITNNTHTLPHYPLEPRFPGIIHLSNCTSILIENNVSSLSYGTYNDENGPSILIESSTLGAIASFVYYDTDPIKYPDGITNVKIFNNTIRVMPFICNKTSDINIKGNSFYPINHARMFPESQTKDTTVSNMIFSDNYIDSLGLIWFKNSILNNCIIENNIFKTQIANQIIEFDESTLTYCSISFNKVLIPLTPYWPISITSDCIIDATNLISMNIAKGSSIAQDANITPVAIGNIF